jgi:hypothetical protein
LSLSSSLLSHYRYHCHHCRHHQDVKETTKEKLTVIKTHHTVVPEAHPAEATDPHIPPAVWVLTETDKNHYS